MNTIRRFYFYGLSYISAGVVIWGIVNLLRTIASKGVVGNGSALAMGLSMVLVGLPIFLLHWRVVQRDAARNPEEQSSRMRAVFLYGALFGTLVPVVYAVMALLDRWLTGLFGLPATEAWLGRTGTALDNLIAAVINALALAYFWTILRVDWRASAINRENNENYLADARRLYRYLLVLFSLTLTVVGVYNLLRYILTLSSLPESQIVPNLVGGISILAVGAPLFGYLWWMVQNSLVSRPEQRSLLRLVVLYLISLAGVVGVLSFAGQVLTALLRWALGDAQTLSGFLQSTSRGIAAAVPLTVMWWYFGQVLSREVAGLPDLPRRAALRRLYDYILSILGLAVAFTGFVNVIDALVRQAFGDRTTLFVQTLSGGLSALLVGLPLWLVNWRQMQKEAEQPGNAGDRARRSVLRKAYLYIVLFLLVIGAMAFTGQGLYTLLNALFGGTRTTSTTADVIRLFLSLLVDAALLLYHWRALRQDGRIAQDTLDTLHAAFPTVIVYDETDPFEQAFTSALGEALAQAAPRLPVAIQPISRGAPDESLLGAKAVMLPVGLLLEPPEALRLWLSEYQGRRILIPIPREDWLWLGQPEKPAETLAREAAQSLRQMSEGERMRQGLPNNPWAIAGYILGGVFGLILLGLLFSLLMSSLFGPL